MFSHRCHGENGEGPGPSEGTFFDFFSNAVRAPNRSPGWPPLGGGGRGGGGEVGPRIGDGMAVSIDPCDRSSWTLDRSPDLGGLRELCSQDPGGSYGIRIPWSSQGRVQVNLPDRSILRIAFGDLFELRSNFEHARSPIDSDCVLGPSELRSLPARSAIELDDVCSPVPG